MTATAGLDRFLSQLQRVKVTGPDEWIGSCPAAGHGQGRGDVHPSLSINRGNGAGPLLKCHAGCDNGSILAGVGMAWPELLPPKETTRRKPAPAADSRTSTPKQKTAPGTITRYEIRDADGKLEAIHVREDHADGKNIRWELPDGTPNLKGRKLETLPLYGIDRLSADSKEIIIAEGEKAADALLSNGIPAVGTVTGSGGTPGDDALRPLLGRTVYQWPDNDPGGRKHMDKIGAALVRLGHRDLRVLDWKAAPAKGDAADLFALEGARDEFDALMDDARPFTGTTTEPAATSATKGPDAGVPLYVRNAADIVPVPVSWLWRERLPVGKLVVFAGEPGQGKSRASLSIASIISRAGFWPAYEGRAEQGEVLIANFEDDEADTSVPRLQAERADLSKIRFLEGVPGDKGRRAFDLTLDADRLAAHLELYPATRLLIVDPISACMGGTDSHRNAEVRGVLQPLADVAKQYKVCVIAITHLNKGTGTKALHRVIGSIAFTAAARVVFAIARDEDDPGAKRTLFLPIKNNLGNDRTGLSFTTVVDQLPSGIYAPRIEWGDNAITTTADEALSPETDEDQGVGREARDFLRRLLADGPMTSKAIQKEAGDAGITQATLRRAREKLGAKVDKDGLGPWTWSLPGGKS
jgi:putative DNA primase/helicase